MAETIRWRASPSALASLRPSLVLQWDTGLFDGVYGTGAKLPVVEHQNSDGGGNDKQRGSGEPAHQGQGEVIGSQAAIIVMTCLVHELGEITHKCPTLIRGDGFFRSGRATNNDRDEAILTQAPGDLEKCERQHQHQQQPYLP